MEDRLSTEITDVELFATAPEPEFDELVHLAAAICNTPMSTITLLDERHQWFKARYGVVGVGCPREISFCDHAIRGADLFVVEDAAKHSLFQNNPLVTQPRGLRFYAGMPIHGQRGVNIGALCVLDYVPRQLSLEQQNALRTLGRQVSAHMELRLQRTELRKALEVRTTLLAELGAREELFKTFMQYSPMASFIKDAKGRYVYYNQRMAESAGLAAASAIGLTDMEIWPAETAHRLQASDKTALDAESVIEIDEKTTVNGDTTEWRCFKFPWRTASGEQMLAGIAVDVTIERRHQAELRHYQQRLEDMNARLTRSANTDPLTGLANRRALDEGIQAAEGTPLLPDQEIAVLTIDIDHFKQVNDTYGHAYGDFALQQIAAAIDRCTRAEDLVARSGGEEFTVLLPIAGRSMALTIAHRILEEVRKISWQHRLISVSVGIATAGTDDTTLKFVTARSDMALYMAKQQGRNRAIYLLGTPSEETSIDYANHSERAGETNFRSTLSQACCA